MEEIGNLFLLTREAAGISLKEVSEDLDIEQALLQNIEDGKIGAFSDVFVLKEYISNYAKYLGLDYEKIVDLFNEHIFETTSKIPVKQIVKEIKEELKQEDKDEVVSPYTHRTIKPKNGYYLLLYILLVLGIIVAVFWAVKQITVDSKVAKNITVEGR